MTICAEFAGRHWSTCTRGSKSCICGMEDPKRVALLLEQHNVWRRGESDEEIISPSVLGLAIDSAVKMLLAMPTDESFAAMGDAQRSNDGI